MHQLRSFPTPSLFARPAPSGCRLLPGLALHSFQEARLREAFARTPELPGVGTARAGILSRPLSIVIEASTLFRDAVHPTRCSVLSLPLSRHGETRIEDELSAACSGQALVPQFAHPFPQVGGIAHPPRLLHDVGLPFYILCESLEFIRARLGGSAPGMPIIFDAHDLLLLSKEPEIGSGCESVFPGFSPDGRSGICSDGIGRQLIPLPTPARSRQIMRRGFLPCRRQVWGRGLRKGDPPPSCY